MRSESFPAARDVLAIGERLFVSSIFGSARAPAVVSAVDCVSGEVERDGGRK